MGSIVRTLLVTSALVAVGASVSAQERNGHRLAYFRAVGSFFDLPASEIAILADWNLPPDEIPVVLFVANRAGVSPEALVALRRSGRSWSELARRYSIGAPTLHVPLRQQASAGPLAPAYDRFRSTPVGDWSDISLSDGEIIALVNVRVLSEALGLRPGEILGRAGSASTFVELYRQLIR